MSEEIHVRLLARLTENACISKKRGDSLAREIYATF
jgi:hypothetical protein